MAHDLLFILGRRKWVLRPNVYVILRDKEKAMDGKKEKDLKDLSQLIVTALTRDESVMSALADLKKRKVIEQSTLLGLALKINDLLELAGTSVTGPESANQDEKPLSIQSEPVTPDSRPFQPSLKVKSMIDGKELSYQEAQFQEWAIAKFDEKQWLKKSGLIW